MSGFLVLNVFRVKRVTFPLKYAIRKKDSFFNKLTWMICTEFQVSNSKTVTGSFWTYRQKDIQWTQTGETQTKSKNVAGHGTDLYTV